MGFIQTSPDWPSGCFRDSDQRVKEMIVVINYHLDEDFIPATMDWIREVDAECESWKEEVPWWKFWG